MKYAWIQEHRDEFSVSRMCRLLDVSRTGYCQSRKRQPSKRAVANAALDAKIAAIHEVSKRSYGRPRIVRSLNQSGMTVSHERVRHVTWSMNDERCTCSMLKLKNFKHLPCTPFTVHGPRYI